MSVSHFLPENWCMVIRFSSRNPMKSTPKRSRAYLTRFTT